MKEGGGGTTREEDTGWGGGGEGRRGGQMVRAWDELWLRKVTAGVRGGHNVEVPLRGRRWPPMACRSPQASGVLLWFTWGPSSSSSSQRGLATVTVSGLGI